jgi:hypothetical protein
VLISAVVHIELRGTNMNSVFNILFSPEQFTLIGGKSHTMPQEYSGMKIQFEQIESGDLAIHRALS